MQHLKMSFKDVSYRIIQWKFMELKPVCNSMKYNLQTDLGISRSHGPQYNGQKYKRKH